MSTHAAKSTPEVTPGDQLRRDLEGLLAAALFGAALWRSIRLQKAKSDQTKELERNEALHLDALDGSGPHMTALGVEVAKRANTLRWTAIRGNAKSGIAFAPFADINLWVSYAHGDYVKLSIPKSKSESVRFAATFSFDRTRGSVPSTEHKIATTICDSMPQRDAELSKMVADVIEHLSSETRPTITPKS